MGKIDHGFLNELAEPDDDAATVKIDYDFLNQIAQMFGVPAVCR